MSGTWSFLALTAAIAATPSTVGNGSGPSPNWSTATAAPERVPQLMNILRLDGDRLLWNGKQVSEAHLREFLGVVASAFNPQPLTVLSYSARTPRESIQRARLLVEEVIQCTPSDCLEVTASPR